MVELRAASARGKANFGWLDSKHSFSFGSYYDPKHMGFSALRVINDDRVAPGAGFDTHGHKDMEIISFVTQGVIEHKDSMGNVQSLPKGEFQLMSAGKGVFHSEYNGSDKEELKFLQIWIEPNEIGGAPGYQQRDFGTQQGLTKVVTPDGADGTLKIKQQASISQLVLAKGSSETIELAEESKAYVHIVSGSGSIAEQSLTEGDGIKITELAEIQASNIGDEPLVALVFELP